MRFVLLKELGARKLVIVFANCLYRRQTMCSYCLYCFCEHKIDGANGNKHHDDENKQKIFCIQSFDFCKISPGPVRQMLYFRKPKIRVPGTIFGSLSLFLNFDMEISLSAPVTLTKGAIKELKRLMHEPGFDASKKLRVGVKGGGCSGMTYILCFDHMQEGDELFEIEVSTA